MQGFISGSDILTSCFYQKNDNNNDVDLNWVELGLSVLTSGGWFSCLLLIQSRSPSAQPIFDASQKMRNFYICDLIIIIHFYY